MLLFTLANLCRIPSIIKINSEIEQLWISLSFNERKYAFGVVYNPHKKFYFDFINNLESTFSTLLPISEDIFCFGDFNVNLFDTECAATSHTLNFFDAFGLTQLVEEPTRVTSSTSTLLDYIVTTNKDLVNSTSVLWLHGGLDHHLVQCNVNLPHQKITPAICKYRDFKNFQYAQFDSDLRSIPWKNIYDLNNIDTSLTF